MAASNGISRRNFIAHSSAIGMTAAAALTLSGSPQANAEEGTEGGSFVQSVAWDAEYDVVVIGYGFAGGVTAIAAADAGAKVLLLEKAMRGLEGGNSRYAGQGFTTPNGDPEKLRTYFRSLRGYFNTPSDAVSMPTSTRPPRASTGYAIWALTPKPKARSPSAQASTRSFPAALVTTRRTALAPTCTAAPISLTPLITTLSSAT